MGLLYLVSYIDRTNAGLAALTMNKDLGFSSTVFGFGADLHGSFCTKRIDRNWLGKELGHAEEETSAGADCASAAADRGCGVPR
jgi:hypothetical protein